MIHRLSLVACAIGKTGRHCDVFVCVCACVWVRVQGGACSAMCWSQAGWEATRLLCLYIYKGDALFWCCFLLSKMEQSGLSRKTSTSYRVMTLGGNNLELSHFHKGAVSDRKRQAHFTCCCASFSVLQLEVNGCLDLSWATLWVSYEPLTWNLRELESPVAI